MGTKLFERVKENSHGYRCLGPVRMNAWPWGGIKSKIWSHSAVSHASIPFW